MFYFKFFVLISLILVSTPIVGFSQEKQDPADQIMQEIMQQIPPIRQVQQAAIEYSEVNINKIRKWSKQASMRGYLPKFNLGFNRDITDLWHWETGSTTHNEDDQLRKGRDVLDWDVTFSWELGDLIWNDAQTSIESRSRMLVQLRGFILDEVTRLYYEYVRLRVELQPANNLTAQKLREKNLRIHEVQAHIDGMTDGYFSRELKSKI